MKLFYTLYLLAFLCSTASFAQNKYIIVGSGGGISGGTTAYMITSAGKILKGNGVGEIKYTEEAKLKRSRAKKYIKRSSEQIQLHSEFNHPGNLYYFIRSVEGTVDRKITWGDMAHPVSDPVQKLYQEINAAISTARFKPIP